MLCFFSVLLTHPELLLTALLRPMVRKEEMAQAPPTNVAVIINFRCCSEIKKAKLPNYSKTRIFGRRAKSSIFCPFFSFLLLVHFFPPLPSSCKPPSLFSLPPSLFRELAKDPRQHRADASARPLSVLARRNVWMRFGAGFHGNATTQ